MKKATHAGLQALMAWGLAEGAQLLSLLGEREQADGSIKTEVNAPAGVAYTIIGEKAR